MILATNHSDHVEERFLNVNAIPCRSLDKFTAQFLCAGQPFLSRNLAFGNTVRFVANQHDGHWARIFDPHDLGMKTPNPFEARAAGNGVDQKKPFPDKDLLLPNSESCVVIPARCVKGYQPAELPVNDTLFPAELPDSGMGWFDELL